ncbi:DNA/RNA non-specific endonuclease [Planococcus sp. APC 4015]|nr:DNA/RNA non-specific endonuclease [Planococcus sp. APC 4015]
MVDEWLLHLAASPWALALLFAVVFADAFLVVVPGEAAVSAFGALAAATGTPPLIAVVAVGALAAFVGDACCYLVGRTVGIDRWSWMRLPRVQRAFSWAQARLSRSTAVVVFTARFIPFARLAVNLVAGASRVPAPRYLLAVGVAAVGWSTYQAIVGAVVGIFLPGGPLVAVVVSIVVAIGLGIGVDAIVAAVSRRRARLAPCAAPGEDEDMADSPGYDPAFLPVDVPLPTASDDRDVRYLAYPRFSVVLDPERRLALVTAVNIDGKSLQDLPRTGDWELDPRIDADEQAGADVYSRNDLDRGHLVRRRDPGWGTVAEARQATEATFFYPNAAPQAAVFNQSKDLWLGLEDHVLAYAEAQDARVSVFTAPVLDPADPPYRGIRIPRRFWKIAAWATTDAAGAPALAAAGFVLDQTELIERSTATAEPLGAYRTFQVPIADIAALAGLDLGPLVAADVTPVAAARPDGWEELGAPADIRL